MPIVGDFVMTPIPSKNRKYSRRADILVALPLTVVKLTCNENGDPDILLLARFHA